MDFEAYRFRPNEPITMGEFSTMFVKGFQIPLSITAVHFSDVPRGHSAFKTIETLYDYSTQSREPFFDYEVRSEGANKIALAHPDQAVSFNLATKIVARLG
ncbi:MAG: hypothetical protein KDA72_09665 [Planctomycetales bacterium]|nr:hypothetical protein [Planctomycetales bacterium]